jgi:hypothetical protein
VILRQALDQVRNRYAMRQFWTHTLDDGRRVLLMADTETFAWHSYYGFSRVVAVLGAT